MFHRQCLTFYICWLIMNSLTSRQYTLILNIYFKLFLSATDTSLDIYIKSYTLMIVVFYWQAKMCQSGDPTYLVKFLFTIFVLDSPLQTDKIPPHPTLHITLAWLVFIYLTSRCCWMQGVSIKWDRVGNDQAGFQRMVLRQ